MPLEPFEPPLRHPLQVMARPALLPLRAPAARRLQNHPTPTPPSRPPADEPDRMRRADRLFQIVQLIRGRRLSTAQFLAERLEVSERTVYRDIAELMTQGVPIEGEAGVGYRMRTGFDLPPLMFTHEEAQALVASVRIAQPRLDAALAAQAENALSKILTVLPPAARAAAETLAVYAPPIEFDPATRSRLEPLRLAAESRRKVKLAYLDLKDVATERTVRPLGCFYWGAVWTLAAWCEVREGFRSFRVDRIRELKVLDSSFRDEPGKTLPDLFRQSQAEAAAHHARHDAS
jgi:predicted DNA-binding transcriptional regulator YafY